MKDKKLHVTERILAPFGFVLKWSVERHWANVEVYRVVATEGDANAPLFEDVEGFSTERLTDLLDNAKIYLDGFVKWDGCSELDQRCPHWCGDGDFKAHCILLLHICCRAKELMDQAPEPDWD